MAQALAIFWPTRVFTNIKKQKGSGAIMELWLKPWRFSGPSECSQNIKKQKGSGAIVELWLKPLASF